jgi:hypothetical protein
MWVLEKGGRPVLKALDEKDDMQHKGINPAKTQNPTYVTSSPHCLSLDDVLTGPFL